MVNLSIKMTNSLDLTPLKSGTWLSKALTKHMQQYRKALPKAILSAYATRHNEAYIKRLMRTKRATKSNRKAVLTVLYEPHPLAHFNVKQTAFGGGGTMKRVRSSKRGLGFTRTTTSQKRQSTLVIIRRGRPFKLVMGRLGFKGFLQAGHGQIFERKQRKTWFGKARAPIQRLYGISISQMAASRIVRSKMESVEDDLQPYIVELEKVD